MPAPHSSVLDIKIGSPKQVYATKNKYLQMLSPRQVHSDFYIAVDCDTNWFTGQLDRLMDLFGSKMIYFGRKSS